MRNYRSSRSHIFFKIGVLKNLAIFTGKYLCWSLFSIKLQTWRPATLLRRDSNMEVSLWNLRNFYKHLFYRTPPVAIFETVHAFSSRFITYQNRKSRLEWEPWEKKTKRIHASATNLLHVRIGNLDWCKCKTLQKQSKRNRLFLLYRGECNAYCFD